jgi:hypothetical protein
MIKNSQIRAMQPESLSFQVASNKQSVKHDGTTTKINIYGVPNACL